MRTSSLTPALAMRLLQVWRRLWNVLLVQVWPLDPSVFSRRSRSMPAASRMAENCMDSPSGLPLAGRPGKGRGTATFASAGLPGRAGARPGARRSAPRSWRRFCPGCSAKSTGRTSACRGGLRRHARSPADRGPAQAKLGSCGLDHPLVRRGLAARSRFPCFANASGLERFSRTAGCGFNAWPCDPPVHLL